MDLHCLNFLIRCLSDTSTGLRTGAVFEKCWGATSTNSNTIQDQFFPHQVLYFFCDQLRAPYKSERRALYRRFKSTTIPDSDRHAHVAFQYSAAKQLPNSRVYAECKSVLHSPSPGVLHSVGVPEHGPLAEIRAFISLARCFYGHRGGVENLVWPAIDMCTGHWWCVFAGTPPVSAYNGTNPPPPLPSTDPTLFSSGRLPPPPTIILSS